MAISNLVILDTPQSGAQHEEFNRSERKGLFSPNRQSVQIAIFDKDAGDAAVNVQTTLDRVEGGRVLKRSDGSVIAAATVKPSGNGTVAALAGLDNSTVCIAEIYGYKGTTGRTLA